MSHHKHALFLAALPAAPQVTWWRALSMPFLLVVFISLLLLLFPTS
jgi:hypothetical protein